MKYIVKNCPAILDVSRLCNQEDSIEFCKDITDCIIKQTIEKLIKYREFEFEFGVKDLFNCSVKSAFKPIDEAIKKFEIEEIKEASTPISILEINT